MTTTMGGAKSPDTPAPVSIRTATIITTTTPSIQLTMTLWAFDTITHCASHATGQVAQYFTAHPCRHETRYLWTTPYAGHELALSVVSVTTPADDDYSSAAALVGLETAPRTRGLTDLLVDDSYHPDFFGTTVPSGAVFTVTSEDDTVAAVHGWYLDAATPGGDAALEDLERGLFLTPATADTPPTLVVNSVHTRHEGS